MEITYIIKGKCHLVLDLSLKSNLMLTDLIISLVLCLSANNELGPSVMTEIVLDKS